MPRPRKQLDKTEIAQVEALSAFLTVEQMADYFGMSKTTFYELMERQPEVSERYKKGKAKAIEKVGQSLLQKALDGNTTAMIFYLKTQANWRESQHIEHEHTEKSFEEKLKDMTDEELEQEARRQGLVFNWQAK